MSLFIERDKMDTFINLIENDLNLMLDCVLKDFYSGIISSMEFIERYDIITKLQKQYANNPLH